MLSNRRLSMRSVILWGAASSARVILWAGIVFVLYTVVGVKWMRVPFTPLSMMGIAVAFYAGFKNNSAYDRFWEGRKIWGGVVNESRTWANGVLAYVMPGDDGPEAHEVRRELLYRHLAWINSLRIQLRSTSRFHNKPARSTRKRLEAHVDHMRNDWDKEMTPFLGSEERTKMSTVANAATHLVATQGQQLARLKDAGKLDLFHQIALMEVLRELYALQGKAERIKKTPFPRLYAEFSRIFTKVFVYIIPFGLLDAFAEHLPEGLPTGSEWAWVLSYLASAGLVGWVFMTMEGLGDSSEDPFERSMNDVPMNALCVVIERDLRQLLGEESIPDPEQPVDGVLY
jgi:putative membrane protein